MSKRDRTVTVRAARKRLGLSQWELAKRVGTDQSDISRMELGKIEPLFSKGLKLADALDVNPHHLKFGTEEAA